MIDDVDKVYLHITSFYNNLLNIVRKFMKYNQNNLSLRLPCSGYDTRLITCNFPCQLATAHH